MAKANKKTLQYPSGRKGHKLTECELELAKIANSVLGEGGMFESNHSNISLIYSHRFTVHNIDTGWVRSWLSLSNFMM